MRSFENVFCGRTENAALKKRCTPLEKDFARRMVLFKPLTVSYKRRKTLLTFPYSQFTGGYTYYIFVPPLVSTATLKTRYFTFVHVSNTNGQRTIRGVFTTD